MLILNLLRSVVSKSNDMRDGLSHLTFPKFPLETDSGIISMSGTSSCPTSIISNLYSHIPNTLPCYLVPCSERPVLHSRQRLIVTPTSLWGLIILLVPWLTGKFCHTQ